MTVTRADRGAADQLLKALGGDDWNASGNAAFNRERAADAFAAHREAAVREWIDMQAAARDAGADLQIIRGILIEWHNELITTSAAVEKLRDMCGIVGARLLKGQFERGAEAIVAAERERVRDAVIAVATHASPHTSEVLAIVRGEK